MEQNQAIRQPFGITTFGSSVIRVDPDIASVQFAVSCTEKQPKDAFEKARNTSQKFNAYLQKADFKKEVSSSRLTLSQSWQFESGVQKFKGYTAKSSFHVLLYDLEKIEDLLVSIVDLGVNEITDVRFQTSKLKDLRAQARFRAVEAAREKAENYCHAAKVELGKVVHLEDVNPEILSGRYEGHVLKQVEPDDTGNIQAFNPGSITIGAAVLVSFDFAKN